MFRCNPYAVISAARMQVSEKTILLTLLARNLSRTRPCLWLTFCNPIVKDSTVERGAGMPAADKLDRPRQLIARVFQFALVSGAGLAIDFCLFIVLVEGAVRTGWANLISAGAAVAFVYLVSVRRIFAYQGQFLVRLFSVYAAYQFAAVTSASWLVDFVALEFDQAPILAKVVVLPLTFTANFLFMSWLTRAKPS